MPTGWLDFPQPHDFSNRCLKKEFSMRYLCVLLCLLCFSTPGFSQTYSPEQWEKIQSQHAEFVENHDKVYEMLKELVEESGRWDLIQEKHSQRSIRKLCVAKPEASADYIGEMTPKIINMIKTLNRMDRNCQILVKGGDELLESVCLMAGATREGDRAAHNAAMALVPDINERLDDLFGGRVVLKLMYGKLDRELKMLKYMEGIVTEVSKQRAQQ